MFRFLRALLALGLLVAFESSCRKRRVSVPVAPPPVSAPQQDRPVTAAPSPPAVSAPQPPPPPREEPKYQVNRPPQTTESQPQQPGTGPRRPSRPTESNGAGQPTQPPANQPPISQSPRLGDVLTPEQERQYNADIDQRLTRAQNSLSAITNRHLTKEQQAVVSQIQGFVQQAQTTRKTNLLAARSLAERADVLARDLVESLR